MKRVDKNKIDEIEQLERQLSPQLRVYKNYKNSENNERYFNKLYHKSISKLEDKSSNAMFSVTPAFSYAILFIISFAVSFLLIDFNNDVSLNDESYLFSDTAIWQEEEEFLSNVSDEELNLDYAKYFNDEINYAGSSY